MNELKEYLNDYLMFSVMNTLEKPKLASSLQ